MKVFVSLMVLVVIFTAVYVFGGIAFGWGLYNLAEWLVGNEYVSLVAGIGAGFLFYLVVPMAVASWAKVSKK